MADKLKMRIGEKGVNIALISGDKIIYANHVRAL